MLQARHKLMYKVAQDKDKESSSIKQLMKIIDTTLVKCYLQVNLLNLYIMIMILNYIRSFSVCKCIYLFRFYNVIGTLIKIILN